MILSDVPGMEGKKKCNKGHQLGVPVADPRGKDGMECSGAVAQAGSTNYPYGKSLDRRHAWND